jgi:hypothetical protein
MEMSNGRAKNKMMDFLTDFTQIPPSVFTFVYSDFDKCSHLSRPTNRFQNKAASWLRIQGADIVTRMLPPKSDY